MQRRMVEEGEGKECGSSRVGVEVRYGPYGKSRHYELHYQAGGRLGKAGMGDILGKARQRKVQER